MDLNKKRRNSILKKTPYNEDDTTGDVTTKIKRRISFSGKKSVKEFIAGEEQATIWGTSYEEAADVLQANPAESGLVNVNEKRIVLRSRRVIVESSRGNKRRSKKKSTVAENDKENICVKQQQENTTTQLIEPIQLEHSKPENEPIIAEVEASKAVNTEIVRFAGAKSDCLLKPLDRGNICSSTFDFINFSGLENRTISIEQSVDVTLSESELQMFKFRVPVEAKHFSPILSLSVQPDTSPSNVFSPSILMSEEDKKILKFMREKQEAKEMQTALHITHVNNAKQVYSETNANKEAEMELAETIKRNVCDASMDLTGIDANRTEEEAHVRYLSMNVSRCDEIESKDSNRRTILQSVDMEEDLPKNKDFKTCQKAEINGDQKQVTIDAYQTVNTARREDFEGKSLKRKTITQSVAMEESCVWTDRKAKTNQNVMDTSEMDLNSPMRKKPMHNATSKPMDITSKIIQSNVQQTSTKRQTIYFESASIEESFVQEIVHAPKVSEPMEMSAIIRCPIGNKQTQVGSSYQEVEVDHNMSIELSEPVQVSESNVKERQTIYEPTDMFSSDTTQVEQKVSSSKVSVKSQNTIYAPCDMIQDSPKPKVIFQQTFKMKTDLNAVSGENDSFRKSIYTPTDMITDSPLATSSIPRAKSMQVCQQSFYSSVDMDEDAVQPTQTLQTSSKKRESVYTPLDIIEDSPTSSTSIMPSELNVKSCLTVNDPTDLSLFQSSKSIKPPELDHEKSLKTTIDIYEDCSEPSLPPTQSATLGPKLVIRHLSLQQAPRDDQIMLRKMKANSKETTKPILESKPDEPSMEMTMIGDLSDSENKMDFCKLNEKLFKGELKSLGEENKKMGKKSPFENLNHKSVDEFKFDSLMINEANGNGCLIQPPRYSMKDCTMELSTRKTDFTIDFSLHSVNKFATNQRSQIEQTQAEAPRRQTIHFNEDIDLEELKTPLLKDTNHLSSPAREESMNISASVVSKSKTSNKSRDHRQTIHLNESLEDDHIEGETNKMHQSPMKSESLVVKPKQSMNLRGCQTIFFNQNSGLEANLSEVKETQAFKDDSAMEFSMVLNESKCLEQNSPLRQSSRQVKALDDSNTYAAKFEPPKIQRRQTIYGDEDLELDDTIPSCPMKNIETTNKEQVHSKPQRRGTIYCNEDLELDDTISISPVKGTERPESHESERERTHARQKMDFQQSKLYVGMEPSKPKRRETIHCDEDLELDDITSSCPMRYKDTTNKEHTKNTYRTERPESHESERLTTHTMRKMDLQQSKLHVETQLSRPQRRGTIHFNEDLELDDTINASSLGKSECIYKEQRPHTTKHSKALEPKRETAHARQIMDLQQNKLYVETQPQRPQRRGTIHFNEDLEFDDTIHATSIEKSECIYNEQRPHATKQLEGFRAKRETAHTMQKMDLQQSKLHVETQPSKPQRRETIHLNEDLELDETIPTRHINRIDGIHKEHTTEHPEPNVSKLETTNTKQLMNLQQFKMNVQEHPHKPQRRETIIHNEDIEFDEMLPPPLTERTKDIHKEMLPQTKDDADPYESKRQTSNFSYAMDFHQSRADIQPSKEQKRQTMHFNEDLEIDGTIPTRLMLRTEPYESKCRTSHLRQIKDLEQAKPCIPEEHVSKLQRRQTVHCNEDLELDDTIPSRPVEKQEHSEPNESNKFMHRTTKTGQEMNLQISKVFASSESPSNSRRRGTIHCNADLELDDTIPSRPVERQEHSELYESKKFIHHTTKTGQEMNLQISKVFASSESPSNSRRRGTIHCNADLELDDTIPSRPVERQEHSEPYESNKFMHHTTKTGQEMNLQISKVFASSESPSNSRRRGTIHCNADLELDDTIPSRPVELKEHSEPYRTTKTGQENSRRRGTIHLNEDLELDDTIPTGPNEKFETNNKQLLPSQSSKTRATTHFDHSIKQKINDDCADLKQEFKVQDSHSKPLSSKIPIRHTLHIDEDIELEKENDNETKRNTVQNALRVLSRPTMNFHQTIDVESEPQNARVEQVKPLPKPRRLTILDEQPLDIDESPQKCTARKSSFSRTLNFNGIQTSSSKVKQQTASLRQNNGATIENDDSPLLNFIARSRLNETTSEIDRSLAEYLKAEAAATLRNSPEISMDVSNSGQKNSQTVIGEHPKSRRQTSHESVNVFEVSGMQPLLQPILKRQTTFASEDKMPEAPAESISKNIQMSRKEQTYLNTRATSINLETENRSRHELPDMANSPNKIGLQKQIAFERPQRQVLQEPEPVLEESDNSMEISMATEEPIKSTASSTQPSRKTIHFTNENAVDETFFDENLNKPAASRIQMKRQTQLFNENQCPMDVSLSVGSPPPKSTKAAQSMKEILLESEKLFNQVELPTFDNQRSTVYLTRKNPSLEESFDTVEIPRRATLFQKNDTLTHLPLNQDEFAETINLTQKSLLKFEDAPITVSDVSTYFSQQMIPTNKPINETFAHNTTEALCKLEVSQYSDEDDQVPKSSDSEDTAHNLAKFKKRYVELTCDSIMLSAVGEQIEKTHLSLVDTLDEMSECVQHKTATETETSKVAGGDIMISALGEEIEKTHLSLVDTLDEMSECVQPKPKVADTTRPLRAIPSVCRKCKRHRLSETQNETTIGSFVLEPLPVYKMNLDALEGLGSKPKISDVAKLWRQKMRESDSFNTSDGSQSNEVDDTDLLDVNQFIATLDKERLTATQCMQKKEVEIKSSFVQRVRKKIDSKNSNWILNELLLSVGILKFEHTRIGTFALVVKFKPRDSRATEVDFSEIQLVPNNQSCKWSAFDYALHYQLLVELPFDVSTLCPTSEHLFQFLDHVDKVTQKVLKTGRDMWYLVLTSPASLIRESSGRLYIQKIERTKTPQNEVKRMEFQIEVRNINKLSYKSIVQPPLYEFDETIQTLPEGLEFLTIFLSDPVRYTKAST